MSDIENQTPKPPQNNNQTPTGSEQNPEQKTNLLKKNDPYVGKSRPVIQPEQAKAQAEANAQKVEQIIDSNSKPNENNNQNQQKTNANQSTGKQETTCKHTALNCLVLVARHHSIDLSVQGLIHEYAIGDAEPDNNRLLRICKETKLKAKFSKVSWDQLRKVHEAFPVIAKLSNGNYVICVGFRENPENENAVELAIFDPLANRPDFIFVTQEKFQTRWNGDILLIKKEFSLSDEKQPFGLRWFIPEILKQKRLFINVGIAAVAIHAISLVTPLFFQLVIDKVLPHEGFATLQVLAGGIVFALIFDAMLEWLRNYLLLYATSKIDIRVTSRTFRHLMSLPMDFFNQISAGVLTQHMQQVSKIREFLTGNLFMTVLDSVALFVFLPILYFYSPQLTFLVLGFSLFVVAVIAGLIKPFNRRLQELYKAEGQRQALLVETIHGMSTVKALSLEPLQRKHWDDKSAQSVNMHFRVGKISITARAIIGISEKLMSVAVVWLGANLVFDSQLTVGSLVAFNMLAGRVSGPLVKLVSIIHEYQETALSVKMLGNVMNQASEGRGLSGALRPHILGNLQFENLNFKYPNSETPALDNVNLTLPGGTVIGFVGRSGSGKTTLTRMVQGLYTNYQGIIRVDGNDLREIDLTHLRRSIGVVLQENFLFTGTVRDNIGAARTNSTFEEIVYVAKMAGADEFIQRLPKGYDTELEENGSNLSGGQRQRLAIARALLTDPRILILDEATSALDPESEGIIRANLAMIAKGRTVLIVTHRLSNLIHADGIVLLDRGKVIAFGPHKTLLEKSTLYRDLWKQQNG